MSSGPCRERTGSKLCNTRNTLFSRKSNSAITIGLKWSKSREILWFWSLFVDNENLEILLQWTCYLVMYVWEDKVSKFSSFFSPRHGPLNWHITLSLLLKYHDQYSAKFINTLSLNGQFLMMIPLIVKEIKIMSIMYQVSVNYNTWIGTARLSQHRKAYWDQQD